MRVTFFGKGGSGKTTMAASFIKFLESKNKNILAVDADINVHLGTALNIDTKYIGDDFDNIIKYLEPKLVSENREIIGTIPPSYNSVFIKPDLDDKFFQTFATRKNNTLLLTAGTYNDKKVGYGCYHTKLKGTFIFYNRLLDNKDFYVVSDATAGIDGVGTSMFNVADLNVFVVEATEKSISVLKDFINVLKKYKTKLVVIGNKIEDEDDINYIKQELSNLNIIGFVNKSKYLKKYEQGEISCFDNFINDQKELNQKLLEILDQTSKNWNGYYQVIKDIFINNMKNKYGEKYQDYLKYYMDDDFNYERIIDESK